MLIQFSYCTQLPMPTALPVIKPSSVTLMIKPVGALCNLDCSYCYYLPTKSVYDGREHKMRLDTLESIFAGYLPVAAEEVTICWQGGEPTLAGLAFFEKAVEFQNKYKRDGQRIWNAIQTNGTLIDDDWAKFMRANQCLIGISVDGPPHFHDKYRVTNRGEGSHDKVLRGLRLLQKYDVEYNILCVLNQGNVGQPEEVFKYLLNLGSRWLQFIPEIVFEPDAETGDNRLAGHCPDPLAYGQFMAKVFDLWFERYRQRVSVRMFDAVLNKLVLGQMPLCILDGGCSGQMTIEHNGDVYGCDHFVERRWQLGQIGDAQWQNNVGLDGSENIGLTIHGTGYLPNTEHEGRDIDHAGDLEEKYRSDSAGATEDGLDIEWFKRTDPQRLTHFSSRKQGNVPEKCHTCDYRQFCHGGCPEHRPHGGDRVEETVLCEGYLHIYAHAMERMEWLASFLRKGQQPPPVDVNVQAGAATDSAIGKRAPVPAGMKPKRNDPCPCGSGVKYKSCCGRA